MSDMIHVKTNDVSMQVQGPDATGRYSLHLSASGESCEIDLGVPRGMIETALLMAASVKFRAALPPAPDADWRNDPSADERWNAGCDFAMTMLCQVVKADPAKVSWDAATETLEGDVSAVIGNILTEGLGEDWQDRAPAPDAVEALVKAAKVLNQKWPYHVMEPAFDAMQAVEGEGVDTMFAAGIRALAAIRAGGKP